MTGSGLILFAEPPTPSRNEIFNFLYLNRLMLCLQLNFNSALDMYAI